MKATILMPYADQVSDIAVEVFDVLVKYKVPYGLMALLMNLDFVLQRTMEAPGCPPEVAAEAAEFLQHTRKLNRALARSLDDQRKEKTSVQ